MSLEWICSCLQLPAGSWPPDHYTLLGLKLGEADSRRIEQRVQERMEKLRPYQLTHTEQATEAMNRLAQAFVCLTDPAAKRAYDASLASGKLRRSPPSAAFGSSRRSRKPDAARFPARARRFPRWLLLAWTLWLACGAAGFMALVHYSPEIKQSLLGADGGVKTGQKFRSQLPSLPGTRTQP
jgi:hypothetical protein